jgi:threonylcarbamoyladenosine tRNA methylthiotransferase MtaB
LGKEAEVLFEEENKNGFIYGYSKNYLRVKLPFNKKLVNTTVSLAVESIDEEGVLIGAVTIPEAA